MPSPPSVAGELPALRTGGGEGRKGGRGKKGERRGEKEIYNQCISTYVVSLNTYVRVHTCTLCV